MSARLDGFASIMATTTGGSGGSGLTEAQMDARYLKIDDAPSGTLTTAQLAAVNSVVNNDYLKVEDADDLYTPRKQVLVTCSMQSDSAWASIDEATLASNFKNNVTLASEQVVTAHKEGAVLRIEVTCRDSNVQTTQTNLTNALTSAAAMSTALGGTVTATSAPTLTRGLLSSSLGEAILSLV